MANQAKPLVQQGRSLPTWLRYGVVGLLVLGIFFRFYHLDRKVYWLDETHTALRMSGHTRAELIAEVFTGNVVDRATLQSYQRLSPEKGWDDTFNALRGNAEHAPLYFLLTRAWVELWGFSIATMRSLPALISLLAFPGVFWLCTELFHRDGFHGSHADPSHADSSSHTDRPATPANDALDLSPDRYTDRHTDRHTDRVNQAVPWVAMALLAVAPVQVLYAQEARAYSLWVVMVLLSSASLLRALRRDRRQDWVWYGLTIALGLYSQLLFALTALAQAIYVLGVTGTISLRPPKLKLTPIVRRYAIAAGAGLLAFSPWLLQIVVNLQKISTTTASLRRPVPFGNLLNDWFLNINLALIDRELGALNLLLVLLSGYAFYYLIRHTPRRTWLLVVAIAATLFLALALPDLLSGGQRSGRLRYQIPVYLCIHIALAYLFASHLWGKRWGDRAGRLGLVSLLLAGVVACAVSSQAIVWWNKSLPRSAYYPPASALINAADRPLVISDGPVVDVVAFSYWLKPEVKFQLTTDARSLRVAREFESVFLLNPTEPMQRILIRRGFQLTPLYEDRTDADDPEVRLWRVQRPL